LAHLYASTSGESLNVSDEISGLWKV
jgi:hypothetical protein